MFLPWYMKKLAAETDTDGGAAAMDEPNTNDPAESEVDVSSLQQQLQELNRALDAEKQRNKAAGVAIEAEKKARKQLERAQMSEAEQTRAKEEELAEKAKKYDRLTNGVAAEKILVNAGLTEIDYKDLLDSFISEDAEKTTSIAQGFADLLKRQTLAAAKAEREKVLKETPTPPAGEVKTDPLDLFLAGFNSN